MTVKGLSQLAAAGLLAAAAAVAEPAQAATVPRNQTCNDKPSGYYNINGVDVYCQDGAVLIQSHGGEHCVLSGGATRDKQTVANSTMQFQEEWRTKVRAGDTPSALYADDAVLRFTGTDGSVDLRTGTVDIAAFWSEKGSIFAGFEASDSTVRLRTSDDASVSSRFRTTNGDVGIVTNQLWRRQDDGSYKIVADQFHMSAPGTLITGQTDAQLMQGTLAGAQIWADAFNRGDLAAALGQYAPNAVMRVLPFTDDFNTTSAIETFWRNLIDAGYKNVEYINTKQRVVTRGAEAIVMNSASWRMNKAHGIITNELWQRQPDGSMKLYLDEFEIINSESTDDFVEPFFLPFSQNSSGSFSLPYLNDEQRAAAAGSNAWQVAFNAGDAVGCGAAYTENATMRALPFGTFKGRAAIQQFWQGIIDAGFTNIQYQDPTIRSYRPGTPVIQSSWNMNAAQGVITLEHWEMQPNGKALLAYDEFEVIPTTTVQLLRTPNAELELGVQQATQRWIDAFNSQNAAAAVAEYSSDAVMRVTDMSGVNIYNTTETVQQFWQGIIDAGFDEVQYINDNRRVIDASTLTQSASWRMNNAHGIIYNEVWRKQSDGSMKLAIDEFEIIGPVDESSPFVQPTFGAIDPTSPSALPLGPVSCGSVAESDVKKLAARSDAMHVSATGYGVIENTDAVGALVEGTNWHTRGFGAPNASNKVIVAPGSFNFDVAEGCTPDLATKWPSVYQACGNTRGMHWLAPSTGLSWRPNDSYPAMSQTWLVMTKAEVLTWTVTLPVNASETLTEAEVCMKLQGELQTELGMVGKLDCGLSVVQREGRTTDYQFTKNTMWYNTAMERVLASKDRSAAVAQAIAPGAMLTAAKPKSVTHAPPPTTTESSLPDYAIALIVIGGALLLSCVGAVVLFFLRRRGEAVPSANDTRATAQQQEPLCNAPDAALNDL